MRNCTPLASTYIKIKKKLVLLELLLKSASSHSNAKRVRARGRQRKHTTSKVKGDIYYYRLVDFCVI